MNMWLHGYPEASIAGKNTISSPQFKEADGTLKRFDFVVANPPFSVKNWTSGINPSDDIYNRFSGYGIPPEKNGDYAFLLHILASLKSTGKGAVILPHGVLFRGNAEAEIRKNIIQRKWIKGIIGLPANLFYGTGIPACIIVVDKEHAEERKGIFMIDASKGYIKDGNKNRLREQDLHKIVDVFNFQKEEDKFSRFVPFEEIEKNEYNLNIPRYIDTQEEEDIQDLNAHLNGGIPVRDIDALQGYWEVYPSLRKELFSPLREGYVQLNVEANAIKETIYKHPEFTAYSETLDQVFTSWKNGVYADLQGIQTDSAPKKFIHHISEELLNAYHEKALVNKYDIYQHLLNYWNETMKDDVYLIVEDGWVAKTKRILEKNQKGKEVDKGWTCDLIPKELVISKYLAKEKSELQDLESELEHVQATQSSLEEEQSGEDGVFGELDKINKAEVKKLLKELKQEPALNMAAEQQATYGENQSPEEIAQAWLDAYDKQAALKKKIKTKEAELDQLTLEQYSKLTEAEVRTLVVDDKWLACIKADIQTEIDAISQRLTIRIKELGERYDSKLSDLERSLSEVEGRVAEHLQKMGLVWS